MECNRVASISVDILGDASDGERGSERIVCLYCAFYEEMLFQLRDYFRKILAGWR